MGHLHGALARVVRVARCRDQPGVGQAADDRLDGPGVGPGRDQLAERRPPLGVLGPLAGLGEAEEDPAAELALGVVEGRRGPRRPGSSRPLRARRSPCRRPRSAGARRAAARARSARTGAGEGPRAARDVLEQHLDQTRLELAPRRAAAGRSIAWRSSSSVIGPTRS